jgi:uncharacterized protein
MISRRRFLTLSATGAGVSVLAGADAFALEPRFGLTVNEWQIASPDWPSGAAPLRIGILTDIHAVEPWMPAARVGMIVDRLNHLKPDIIFLLGDYVNALRPRFYTATVPINEWAAALNALSAPLGVYAVFGNHDWWSGEVPAIRRIFAGSSIVLLENERVRISKGSHAFWVAGLADQLNSNRRGAEDLQETLSGTTEGEPIVLLAHEPDVFAHVPSSVTLTLAGHTHGGQVYLPFVGRPVFDRNGFSRYAQYAYGHFNEKGRHLVVSAGLGLSHFPVRFLVPPEIAIVSLSGVRA